MANDLIVIEGRKLDSIFTENKVDEVIADIQNFARSVIAGDVSTKKGSDEVRSMAANVRRTKVALEEAGKEITAKIKKKAKDETAQIDGDVKKVGETLTALAEEIRKPLTEWEDKEKSRTQKHEADCGIIANALMFPAGTTSDQLTERIIQIDALRGKDWEEFSDIAKKLFEQKVPELERHRDALIVQESQAVELAKLKKEAEDRAQADRDAEISRQAAERATAIANEKAKRDAEALQEGEWRELALIAGGHVQAIRAQEKAEADAKIAAEKAAQDERNKALAKQLQDEADEKRRKDDSDHRLRITSEAAQDIQMQSGLFPEQAEIILLAIMEGKIRHVAIKF